MLDRVLTIPRKAKERAQESHSRRLEAEVRKLEAKVRKQERREARRQELRARKLAAKGTPPPAFTRFLAWCVHLYTAMGLVCASGMAYLLVQGGPDAFRWTFVLMAVATLIDATDGTLARKIKIKEVLPDFDGRKLDDITDFLTYTALPLLLIWRADLLPMGTEWSLVLPLLASAYGFCQGAAKTDDGYFLGFPSLWNVVAFYLYVLQTPPWIALGVVQVLAVMTFVPSRYLYPSQPGRLTRVDNLLSVGWAALLFYLLFHLPASGRGVETEAGLGSLRSIALASLYYPVFYMGASWVVTVVLWRKKRLARQLAAARADLPESLDLDTGYRAV
jgi:phosphatidylcholine synthase